MAGRLEGKVALISGGAGGMGESHARRFVEEGARVVIGDIQAEKGEALASELGSLARFVRLDVTKAQDWADAVATADEVFGPVTVLINNAGILELGSLEEMTEEDYRRVIDINQIGVFLGMKAVIEPMRRAGGGTIVNISSMAGLHPSKHGTAYCSTKHAVTGMTRVAALDLAAYNIRVNSVHPGMVQTPMIGDFPASQRQPIPRHGRPEEITAMVLFLASDESSYCTGSQYPIDGGFGQMVGDLPDM